MRLLKLCDSGVGGCDGSGDERCQDRPRGKSGGPRLGCSRSHFGDATFRCKCGMILEKEVLTCLVVDTTSF